MLIRSTRRQLATCVATTLLFVLSTASHAERRSSRQSSQPSGRYGSPTKGKRPKRSSRPPIRVSGESWGETRTGDPSKVVIKGLRNGDSARLLMERPSDGIALGKDTEGYSAHKRALRDAERSENVWSADSVRTDADGQVILRSPEIAKGGDGNYQLTRTLEVNGLMTVEARGSSEDYRQSSSQERQRPKAQTRRSRKSARVKGSPIEREVSYQTVVTGHRQVRKPMNRRLAQFKGVRWRDGMTHSVSEPITKQVEVVNERGGHLAAQERLFVQRRNILKTHAYRRKSDGQLVVMIRGTRALSRGSDFVIRNEGTGVEVQGKANKTTGGFKIEIPIVSLREQKLVIESSVLDPGAGVESKIRADLGTVTFARDTSGPIMYQPVDRNSGIKRSIESSARGSLAERDAF